MVGTHIHIIKTLIKFHPENVFEIGSRDGKDAVCYADEFNIDHKNVLVFEPNPVLAQYIKDTYPNIRVRTEAISSHEGTSSFNCAIVNNRAADDDWTYYGMSSLYDRDLYGDSQKKVRFKKIMVDVKKMSTVIEQLHIDTIDICKIDTEGNSYPVLSSFEKYISIVKTFHIEMEYYPYWENQILAPKVKEFLMKHNFTLITENFIGNTDQSDSIWINNKFL